MKFAPRLTLLAAAFALAAAAQAQIRPYGSENANRPAPVPTAPAAPAAPANPEFENAGRAAAQAWLQMLDRADWGTSWDSASQVFRQNVPLDRWMDAVPKVRQPLGTLVERQTVESVYKTTLQGRPNGHYVSVVFTSKFQKGELNEIVTTVRDTDGRWRVTGYSPQAK